MASASQSDPVSEASVGRGVDIVAEGSSSSLGGGVTLASHQSQPISSSSIQHGLCLGPLNAMEAGQSSVDRSFHAEGEGELYQDNLEDSPQPFEGPSSAPPTPSVISVTHPPQFIHTHHPRRGSLTPLGLNVISPVPPTQIAAYSFDQPSTSSPVRSIGFSPLAGEGSDRRASLAYTDDGGRRGSVASWSSNLTATRPSNSRRSSLTSPLGTFNPARRTSLTPSLPTLAGPSPTRALASGRLSSRPMSSDGPSSTSATTTNHPRDGMIRGSSLLAEERRGSLPHVPYASWTGPTRSWNPSLPPQRGSIEQEDAPVIDEGFKFGSGPPPVASSRVIDIGDTYGASASASAGIAAAASSITATSSLRRLSAMSGKRKEDVFQQAEDDEAQRQQRAFIAATFGQDGKRARERLSLSGWGGAAGSSAAILSSPGGARRQSLILWERLNRGPDSRGPSSAPAFSQVASFSEDSGVRRPSLPIAIPGSSLGRTFAGKNAAASFDNSPPGPDSDDDAQGDSRTPLRPLPPLLPLSDPGPRLLPSTLALHRATHLLNSRNLESAPLPAPLPPSLHPPAPVDLSEFDIDFILAGSRTNLGRNLSVKRKSGSSGNDGSGLGMSAAAPPKAPGGDEEDSFAKFVGAFDDEYGGRRGHWTFRACPPRADVVFPIDEPDMLDPLDTELPRPRSEWESPGAGRFEIFSNGDVVSVLSGRVWHLRKTNSREFELSQPHRQVRPPAPTSHPIVGPDTARPLVLLPFSAFTLASRIAHTENGGVKLPTSVQRELTSRGGRLTSRFLAATRTRASISEMPEQSKRIAESLERKLNIPAGRERFGSQDSDATAMPFSRSLPPVSSMPVMPPRPSLPVPPQQSSFKDDSGLDERGRHGVSFAEGSFSKITARDKRDRQSRSKERGDTDEKQKKSSSLGGVLKRGLVKASNLVKDYEERKERREERDRERAQSHSWSGGSSASSHWSVATNKHAAREQLRTAASNSSNTTTGSSQRSSKVETEDSTPSVESDPLFGSEDLPFGSLGLGIEDEQNGGLPWKGGVAWEGVPEESLAMVIPIEADPNLSEDLPSSGQQPFINPFFVDGPRQALLVWFTPFNASEQTQAASSKASSLFKINESVMPDTSDSGGASPSGSSLGRLPKLLRRRGSRSETGKRDKSGPTTPTSTTLSPTATSAGLPELAPIIGRSRHESCNLAPLPFRAFRIVAKVVECENLRSEPEVPVIGLEQWQEQNRTGRSILTTTPPPDADSADPGIATAAARRGAPVPPGVPTGISSGIGPLIGENPSAADIMAGRAFPTVIGVCHSMTSGVEFVLEGLDRLGLCKGESAWGPTGYEEWRGSGLSDQGRQLLDLLWTGCSAIMSL